MISHADFSVVVTAASPPPQQWQWAIYRAGRRSPISRSPIGFETESAAGRAGKAALARLLSEVHG